MNWIIIGAVLAFIIYQATKKKKPEPDPPPPPPPPVEYPWSRDEVLVTYFNMLIRPYTHSLDLNFGPEEAEMYGYNSARGTHNCPRNIWEGRSGNHTWDDQISYFKKDGKTFLLDHYNPDFFNALFEIVKDCDERGMPFVFSLFDGCGLKYNPSGNNHWAFAMWNNFRLDGGSVDKFFRVGGVFWDFQKNIVREVLKTVGQFNNLILELANEPFGNNNIVIPWHEQMMGHTVATKQALGCDHVKIQVNAGFSEMSHLGCEFVSTHEQNANLNAWDRISQINPHGYGDLPGKCVKSFDWNHTRHNVDFEAHVNKAKQTRNSIEVLPFTRQQSEAVQRAMR